MSRAWLFIQAAGWWTPWYRKHIYFPMKNETRPRFTFLFPVLLDLSYRSSSNELGEWVAAEQEAERVWAFGLVPLFIRACCALRLSLLYFTTLSDSRATVSSGCNERVWFKLEFFKSRPSVSEVMKHAWNKYKSKFKEAIYVVMQILWYTEVTVRHSKCTWQWRPGELWGSWVFKKALSVKWGRGSLHHRAAEQSILNGIRKY